MVQIKSKCYKLKKFYLRDGPRYKQIKMRYQISNTSNVGQFSVMKFVVPHCLAYISAPLCFTESGFEIETCPRMPLLNWDISQLSKMFIAREMMRKSWQY